MFEAFCFLHPSRPSGFGLGAIPLAEIVVFCDVFPLGMPRDEFVRIIRLVDAGWLKEQNTDGPHANASGKD